MKRAENIALLQSLLTGTASPKQIEALRQSREPIRLTMILDEEMANIITDPQYCIDMYTDGTTRCYDRYADGREIDRVT